MSNWIIGIGGSEEDGVSFFGFTGSEEDVKEMLLELVNQGRAKEDDDEWELGTESVEEISLYNGSFYAYGSYRDYHIDYSAKRVSEIEPISLKEPITRKVHGHR